MSKRFWLRVSTTKERITITVDDDDAWRLRNQQWLAKKGKTAFSIYRKNCGTTETLAREVLGLGIQKNGVCVIHKNSDFTDFRKANLLVTERRVELQLARIDSHIGFEAGQCKAGHDLSILGTYSNGKARLICAQCHKDRARSDYRKKKEWNAMADAVNK